MSLRELYQVDDLKGSMDKFQPEYPEFKPRLIPKERLQALVSYDDPHLDDVVDEYRNWVNFDEYIVFKKEHKFTRETKYKVVKMAKRGNDVYAWRSKKRFNDLLTLPDAEFFDYNDRSKNHQTQALFVTLTMARARCPTPKCGEFMALDIGICPKCYAKPRKIRIDQGWVEVSYYYNRWISRLRGKYGKIGAIRVNEAHKDGWPHVHAILIFESKTFNTFHSNGIWRVQGKKDLEWKAGFTDVEALASIQGGLQYVVKYLSKLHGIRGDHSATGETHVSALVNQASTLTLAMMWAFRKRAFGISRGLLDLITTMTNSKTKRLGQVDLMGDPVWVWSIIGFWGGSLGLAWSKEISLVEMYAMKRSSTWSVPKYA